MNGKIVFVNPASRLAAAYTGKQQYVVFEYQGIDHFKEGEELTGIRDNFGHGICRRTAGGKKVAINVLSSAMSYAKAKLVVAPWQDVNVEEKDVI